MSANPINILIDGTEFTAQPIGEPWTTKDGATRVSLRVNVDAEEREEIMFQDLQAQAKAALRGQGLRKASQKVIDAMCEKIILDANYTRATDVRTTDGIEGYINRHQSKNSLVVTLKTGTRTHTPVTVETEEEITL